MKLIPYVMLAGTLAMAAACSSTSTEATSGSSPATSSAEPTRMGTDMNPTPAPDANSGMAADGSGAAGAAGATSATGTGSARAGSGGNASDMNAFMGTFATMEDPVFLMTAASSNMLEIQSGKLAAQQATAPEVKSFAQMMVTHHTQATQELKSVATPLGVTMPTTLMPVHQAMADRLMNKTGKDFDETYMDMMETAHKMDIAMFEAKSKSAQAPTVKGFATRTLPMLRSHESAANKIEKKVD